MNRLEDVLILNSMAGDYRLIYLLDSTRILASEECVCHGIELECNSCYAKAALRACGFHE